jgi:hypothetical protein
MFARINFPGELPSKCRVGLNKNLHMLNDRIDFEHDCELYVLREVGFGCYIFLKITWSL